MALTTLCALLVLGQGAKATDVIAPPPEELSFQGFYKKCVTFRGIPILGSEKVEDRALTTIVKTFDKMLAKVPDAVFAEMVKGKVHYSIIAFEEGQTDLPEYRHMKNDPKMDWDKRARGLGGRVTSGGEENILEYPEDRYKGESIFIHEFAHTLASHGFSRTDPKFSSELKEAFTKGIAEGLWKQTYAATNEHEYWAEGVQSYFDCNRSAIPPNGIHNEICNREQLKAYDPRLFALLDRTFGENPWRYEGSYNTTKKK
jgi:alpha-glucosidase